MKVQYLPRCEVNVRRIMSCCEPAVAHITWSDDIRVISKTTYVCEKHLAEATEAQPEVHTSCPYLARAAKGPFMEQQQAPPDDPLRKLWERYTKPTGGYSSIWIAIWSNEEFIAFAKDAFKTLAEVYSDGPCPMGS